MRSTSSTASADTLPNELLVAAKVPPSHRQARWACPLAPPLPPQHRGRAWLNASGALHIPSAAPAPLWLLTLARIDHATASALKMLGGADVLVADLFEHAKLHGPQGGAQGASPSQWVVGGVVGTRCLAKPQLFRGGEGAPGSCHSSHVSFSSQRGHSHLLAGIR